MERSKNGIEVLSCYFDVDYENYNFLIITTDVGLGDMIYYDIHAILYKEKCEMGIYCKSITLAKIKLPSLEDFTFEIIADLTTTALQNLSTTHKCKKCASPMEFDNRRSHVNGICRPCLRDYTHNKSKWGLTSVEQYKNAECPITHEKLELGSTYITNCCKTGIEWDAFNEYCKKKEKIMIMALLTSSVQCVVQAIISF